MQVYQVGHEIVGLIFDMDNTLYTNSAYASHQETVLVSRLAKELGCPDAEAQQRVDSWRDSFASTHQGRKPSLGNTFAGLGIPITTSVDWRRAYLQPELFLEANPSLAMAVGSLARYFRLAVVTNNPVEIARRTLEIIGILEFIPVIIGLDSTNVSKPDPAAFQLAASALDCQPSTIISIGDRYEVDIEPALSLGMGGILVSGVTEVYNLPDYLLSINKV